MPSVRLAWNLNLRRCVLWKLHQGVVHYPGAVHEYVDRPELFFGTRHQRSALVAVRDERNKRRELDTDQTETRTRLAEAAERAKDLEGVRLDTAAEARRLAAALDGRVAADPG